MRSCSPRIALALAIALALDTQGATKVSSDVKVSQAKNQESAPTPYRAVL